MAASFLVLACCMAGVGWWVSREIQTGVVHETAGTTALYMDSFVAPLVQELATAGAISQEHVASLDALVRETPLGQQVVSFKIWDGNGRIAYSTNSSLVGQSPPMTAAASRARHGFVASGISDLDEPEHANERRFGKRLLETYSPVRKEGTREIIAVAEFYQTVDELDAQLSRARLSSWLVVGFATIAMYLMLAGIVGRGSDTIERQQADLRDKVKQLTGLLQLNQQLGERVRRAASGTTARTERFLRRFSAELHDGPAQALGFAVLRLDSVIAHSEQRACDGTTLRQASSDLQTIQKCLREALDEIRALSGGLSLPELEDLTLCETLVRVTRAHEQRSNSRVELKLGRLPQEVGLPGKITLYRVIQEALSNAYRHAGGVGQQVSVDSDESLLRVEISDQGPGLDWNRQATLNNHLGLEGMRDRVESLGGSFAIESGPDAGVRVLAELPLHAIENNHAQ